jgi:hypothetical protein
MMPLQTTTTAHETRRFYGRFCYCLNIDVFMYYLNTERGSDGRMFFPVDNLSEESLMYFSGTLVDNGCSLYRLMGTRLQTLLL